MDGQQDRSGRGGGGAGGGTHFFFTSLCYTSVRFFTIPCPPPRENSVSVPEQQGVFFHGRGFKTNVRVFFFYIYEYISINGVRFCLTSLCCFKRSTCLN